MNGHQAKQQRRNRENEHYQARLNLATWCALSIAGGDREEVRQAALEFMQANDAQLIEIARWIALRQPPLRSMIRPRREVAHG